MADRKWELDQRTTYQVYMGVYQAARLLHASDTGTDGPFEMAYETNGVEGWDDILVFEQILNNVYANHYQVKEQTTDFEHAKGEKNVQKYFQDAATLLESSTPYRGSITVPPERRHFILGFPDLSVGLLQNGRRTPIRFSTLEKLTTKCRGPGSSHVTIANSKGSTLDNDEKLWLEVVRNSVGGDWLLAANVLRQLELRPLGTKSQIRELAESILGLVWNEPACAFRQLEQVVRASTPSSRLYENDFLSALAKCKRVSPSVRVRFCNDSGRYFVRDGQPITDSVALLWRTPNAWHLSVNFACNPVSVENRALDTAILRLSLHTSGVTATRSVQWWVASRDGLRGALGVSGDAFYTKEEFFNNNLVSTVSHAPPNSMDLSGFQEALTDAMDAWLWSKVDSEVKSIIYREARGFREEFLRAWAALSRQILPHWKPVLKSMLKAECEGASIAPELRAGPRLVSLIAQTLTIVTALYAIGYYSDSPGSLGKVKDSRIYGVALDHISDQQSSDGGVVIWRRARELVNNTGVLVLGSTISVADFLEWTQDGLTNPSGFDSPAPHVVLSFEPKFLRALEDSPENLRRYFDNRIKSIRKATEDVFEATLSKLAKEEST